jgi:hypothetical protein
MRKLLVVGISSLIVVIVAFFVLTTAGYASAGEPLYGLQSGAEQVRLTLTLIPSARADYTRQLFANSVKDLVAADGPVDPKIDAANQAFNAMVANQQDKQLGAAQQKTLRVFYDQTDRSIQTCCLGTDTEQLTLLRKKWKGFDLLVDAAPAQQVDWNILGGEELSAAATALLSGKGGEDVATGAFTHAWFPLTGKHLALGCESCHTTEVRAKGTVCSACHAPSAPADHFPFECSTCHTTAGWEGVVMNHSLVSGHQCATCHAGDKPENHYALDCSNCHTPGSWAGASFSHPAELVTNCLNCHNPRAGHYSINCGTCHTTNSWAGASFSHPAELVTNCMNCHNPRAGHYSINCSTCHTTNSWAGAVFTHLAELVTNCMNCHSPRAGHYSVNCSACHNTNSWAGAVFTHPAALISNCLDCHSPRAGHYTFNCAGCHTPGSWSNVSINHKLVTNCSSCHYRPGNHVGGECSNCHAYPSFNRGHPWFSVNHNGAGGTCTTCHPGGNAYITDCQTCHAANGEGGGGDHVEGGDD